VGAEIGAGYIFGENRRPEGAPVPLSRVSRTAAVLKPERFRGGCSFGADGTRLRAGTGELSRGSVARELRMKV